MLSFQIFYINNKKIYKVILFILNKEDNMITNKRGLSTIVTTLIIILLVLAAIAIVWVVISNLVGEKSDEVSFQAKCLSIDVRATAVECSGGSCDVTLTRGAMGADDVIDGVKLVFSDGTETSDVIEVSGDIEILGSKTEEDIDSGLSNPDKVEVTVYFVDDSGNDQICPNPNPFEF